MVQLPGISRHEWPYFREMKENLSSSNPNTHLIVTLDLGDSLDVHPTNKEAVGKRLANKALAETYQFKNFSESPSLSHIEVKDRQIVISFNSTGDLTTADQQPIRGFELVGLKGKKIQVEAFSKGKTVIINFPEGFDTKEIWYCFSPFPSPNLTDNTGLPIPPFRQRLKTPDTL
jgi:sialate O-acetylesterase